MKKLIIIGKSCSGKTELGSLLKKNGLKVAVTYTSRPIRPNEKNGIHYHFVTKDYFESLIHSKELLEWDNFNDWFYGLPKVEFERSDAMIMTPRGLEKIKEKYGRDKINVVFLDTSPAQRLYRSTLRGDKIEEIQRRFQADEIDFREFIESEDWDLRIDLRVDDNFKLLTKLFSQTTEL
jgi:guanylate kinase